MIPNVIFFADVDEVVEKVAAQMGFTPQEAVQHMIRWDMISVETFRVGNDYPRKELH
jgi:hypothetical protein